MKGPTTQQGGAGTPYDSGNESFDAVFALAYDELRVIAHRHMARRKQVAGPTATIGTTALVNEAYLKLVGQAHGYLCDRSHFFGVAAVAMRHILIDRAKARVARKRGGVRDGVVTLDEEALAAPDASASLLEINDALDRLAKVDARLARVVECRFFGGLSEHEIAEALGVTVRTVERDWAKARALLRRELGR